MSQGVITPQLQIPFRINGAEVAVVEQDSAEDKIQNAISVLRYETGRRTALPEYGIPDQAFRQGGLNSVLVINALLEWEPEVDVRVIQRILEHADAEALATIVLSARDYITEGGAPVG